MPQVNTVNIHVGPDGKLTDAHKNQIRESFLQSVPEDKRAEARVHLDQMLDGYGNDPLKLSAATITAGLMNVDNILEALGATTLQIAEGLDRRARNAGSNERKADGRSVFDAGEVYGQITAARLILMSAAEDLDHTFTCGRRDHSEAPPEPQAPSALLAASAATRARALATRIRARARTGDAVRATQRALRSGAR